MIIEAKNLVKRYGKTTAVNGISLQVERGEALGLLGPNGAGKSTTISMMMGLIRPDGGSVTVAGHDPTLAKARQTIGLAPQALSLYEELTATENLSFLGRLYGLMGPALKSRVAWALEFAGLVERRGDRVATYSGGMKRRLNLAAALIHEPEIVLLDEPTVGVDPQSRNHLMECIEQLQADGMTVLYTTHYMEEVQRLCQRVAIVDRGSLLALDTVDNLIAQHGGDSIIRGTLREQPAGSFELGGVLEGRQWELTSSDPLSAVATAVHSDHAFESLAIERPNLESVFLKLTGRSLRD